MSRHDDAPNDTDPTESPSAPPGAAQSDQPTDPARRRLLSGIAALGATWVVAGCDSISTSHAAPTEPEASQTTAKLREKVRNVVVIYAENRSFTNLFGNFPGVQTPLDRVATERFTQLDRDGVTPLDSLPKIWGGLVPQAQQIGDHNYVIAEDQITNLPNAPFGVSDETGVPLPTSVITRDLVHRFYQNQMQINAGRNNQFVAWADSGALVMGHYRNDAASLKLWSIAQKYTLCDNFFMAAFGGSWLNHIYLISGQTPRHPDVFNSPAKKQVSVLVGDDPTGTRLQVAPNSPKSALDGPPVYVKDGAYTPDGHAVNTVAPPYQPSFVAPAPGGDAALADPSNPSVLPPQGYATIGDRLSARQISWAWYAGAWQDALTHRESGSKPNFQFHHQPFNYFQAYAPGTTGRTHLRDGGVGDDPSTNKFLADIDAGNLPAVTFYKPQGNLNMHAGYADVESGDAHLANIIAHLERGPQWGGMVVVVTVDENGGWWDPVTPPEGDRWGPGSRIPALVISPFAKKGFVDHTTYDTNSILRLVSRIYDLEPLDGVRARDVARVSRGQSPFGDLTHALELA